MIGEIIAIGNELTSGRILNTNSGYAARRLFEAGHTIHAMNTIGDSPVHIGEALLQAIGQAEFIIVTGGLGATDDDMTNEAVSHALNLPTVPNLEMLAKIRKHLRGAGAAPDDPLEKLAWLPSGAEAFDPSASTAGYLLIHHDTPIFFLPGVPAEMRKLLDQTVLPKLADWQKHAGISSFQRIYRIHGIAESEINRSIIGLVLKPEIKIGYYPVFPDVHLSILIRGTNGEGLRSLFNDTCIRVENMFATAIYGQDEQTLEAVVGDLLLKKKMILATAESCTGGLLAHRVTRIPGSSRYFTGGVVSYANELKEELLGVPTELISRCGAVSRQVAEAMAIGVMRRCRSDIGIGITGIAGPDGGTTVKPVGTVFFGVADRSDCSVSRHQFSGDRNSIQEAAAHTGLDLLRRYLLAAS